MGTYAAGRPGTGSIAPSGLLAPRWPALQDRQMAVGDVDPNSDLIANPIRHPRPTPSLHPRHVRLRQPGPWQ